MRRARWQFWIDRGGTFTDCIGHNPSTGEVRVAKVLSSDTAPIEAIRRAMRIAQGAPLPPCDVRMGTTIATNALLERKGVPCVLVTTRGFGDVLEIGTQARPDLFDLRIRKPIPLYAAVLEVDARLSPDGSVLARPDPLSLLAELQRVRASGIDSAAIVLLHSYRNGTLEAEIGDLARRAGFSHVSLSHEIAPHIGLLSRGDTTTLDAYLTPLLDSYLKSVLSELPGSTLRLMQSSGGLVDASLFRGPNAIFSGPAGGAVAVGHVARECVATPAIGFDMGGTSTDVYRFAGDLDLVYEREIAGIRVTAPSIDIHTVAAGGGSICRVLGTRLTVGPESAGADPGPLCYGRAGARELTITDVNLFLGRILSDRFPFPLDLEAPRRKLARLSESLAAEGTVRTPEELAIGFFDIANHAMAEAIRQVSVARGYDVRDHALVAFGGAAGQHACAVARILGVTRLLVHPLSSLLSAYGMGIAEVAAHRSIDVGRVGLEDAALAAIASTVQRLKADCIAALRAEGIALESISVEERVDIRHVGTESALTVPLGSGRAVRAAFDTEHRRLFGYDRPDEPVELVAIRAEAREKRPPSLLPRFVEDEPAAHRERRASLWLHPASKATAPVFERRSLRAGERIQGPALIVEDMASIVVESGCSAELRPDGVLELCVGSQPTPQLVEATEPDPALLEIMGNRFMSIAEQMGRVLRRTAISTNIRERLDFSCAVFDGEGGLVANAPHIPVHLGAMSESVRAVIARHPQMEPGDVYATNDPAAGGSHLPDVTVVSPVHDEAGSLLFFVVSRGHHADVGGITPGSMPPFSSSLADEGVVFSALPLVRSGVLQRMDILAALRETAYPARTPEINLLDLQAQIASNRKGSQLLSELVREYGERFVASYMTHVQSEAARAVVEAIRALETDTARFADALDDGTPIAVSLMRHGDALTIDFSGSGHEHAGNLNAPRAVTLAAVIYFLRALAAKPIPLNRGCLAPVTVLIPEPSVLAPGPLRAVAGGNVETSQRIVDVLLAASGRAAASQGTMNNLTFGDGTFGYYETIAGGAGAGPDFAGASAVHTHMTNTRITDVEVLESRYPVRVREFSIRRGSGGQGRCPGGDGIVRELEFLEAVQVSILSERRIRAPFGLAGGAPGRLGRNTWNGRDVGGKTTFSVVPFDRVRIETPGGGGYGG